MCKDGKCGGCCVPMKIGKWLLIIGGINWGLIGIGMLMGNGIEAWNVVHMIFVSLPVVEGIIYILVGIAAVMKIFGCRCKKCMGTSDMGSGSTSMGMDKKM